MSDSNKRSRYKLTAKQIKSTDLKPDQRSMKLADGSGLTLLFRRGAKGTGKYWQLRYLDPLSGKEQTASLGTYPEITLSPEMTISPISSILQSVPELPRTLIFIDWIDFPTDNGLL